MRKQTVRVRGHANPGDGECVCTCSTQKSVIESPLLEAGGVDTIECYEEEVQP